MFGRFGGTTAFTFMVRKNFFVSLHHPPRQIHYPVDGGSVFLRNFEIFNDCTARKPKRRPPWSVHRRNTNKMQLVIEFIITTFIEGLTCFERHTAHHQELKLFAASGLYTHVVTGRCQSFPLSLDNGRSPHGHIHQRLQIQFRTPDDERCAARNMLSLQ
jgi:hypothetical protein